MATESHENRRKGEYHLELKLPDKNGTISSKVYYLESREKEKNYFQQNYHEGVFSIEICYGE